MTNNKMKQIGNNASWNGLEGVDFVLLE